MREEGGGRREEGGGRREEGGGRREEGGGRREEGGGRSRKRRRGREAHTNEISQQPLTITPPVPQVYPVYIPVLHSSPHPPPLPQQTSWYNPYSNVVYPSYASPEVSQGEKREKRRARLRGGW